jgi:hypothetical protein
MIYVRLIPAERPSPLTQEYDSIKREAPAQFCLLAFAHLARHCDQRAFGERRIGHNSIGGGIPDVRSEIVLFAIV